MISLTKKQARQFILIKQGLIGDYKFIGKEGVLAFVQQAGCIQFDPIDVCGKNPELVLQSRVEGFSKKMLYSLLYEDRCLIDYFDKCLAIMDVNDWKYFERIREMNRSQGRGQKEVNEIAAAICAIIAERGPICSKDLDMKEKVDWYWSETNLSRAALETLYFRGDLIVHHKKGTIKYYTLAKDYISQEVLHAKDPFENEHDYLKWRVLRRISAVGLLWNKGSDAWIYIQNLKSMERNLIFQELLSEKKIIECQVEDCKDSFYCVSDDQWILDQVMKNPDLKGRTELIAPLDSMLWDRKLIKEIFDFEYKWEIYTPLSERKYGYYVLPILSGEQFVGRTEVIADRKNGRLILQKIWLEKNIESIQEYRDDLDQCFHRFMEFHGLNEMVKGLEYEVQG